MDYKEAFLNKGYSEKSAEIFASLINKLLTSIIHKKGEFVT